MKRVERTLQLLVQLSRSEGRGVDANELAARLGAARQNVSADLNQLVREGRAVKVEGRPVLYWEAESWNQMRVVHRAPFADRPAAAGSGTGSYRPTGSLSERPQPAPFSNQPGEPHPDPLSSIIGAADSLRRAVEQAKAAVLYPPHGLHTLLIGPTGVGKSFLAERMHAFAIAAGRLPAGAPFVTLNCADYAANPQLLLAHLFGAVKGAYTGAEKDRLGLVQQADGGILFLDEVHRLPPEGQEMLFRMIDKGLVRRLGDAGPEQAVRVMLVAATTERPDSALLQTFTRRIPMLIPLPPLAERTAAERLRFVRHLLRQEAAKIGLELLIPQETLRLIMEYDCAGNVGQLASDLQIACARLFLQVLTNRSASPATMLGSHLPEHILRTAPPVRHRSRAVEELLQSLGGPLLIRPGAPVEERPGERHPSFYDRIEAQLADLASQGLDREAAATKVAQDLERHFQAFIAGARQRHQSQRQELAKLVGPAVLQAVERALLGAEEGLGRAIPERILYTLALHIHAFLEREASGQATAAFPVAPPIGPNAKVAERIVAHLREALGVALPPSDEAFVAMLLGDESAESPASDSAIGLVVLAHGRVASAMVGVSTALTGLPLAESIDMELETPTATVAALITSAVQEGRYPGGLLLLVDMGSLEAIGEEVQRRTGLPVRTIPLVSTPLVIEAIHQASVPGATLDQVYQAVLNARASLLGRDGALPGVVLTFCFTGVGGAQTLARIVRHSLSDLPQPVDVIPAALGSDSAWNRLVETLMRAHRLRAVVGPVAPKLPGVPYISTEEIVQGAGQVRLRRLFTETGELAVRPSIDEPETAQDLIARMATTLAPHLRSTNPAVTVPLVIRCLQAIEAQMGALESGVRVGLTMHLACLLDRKIEVRLDGRVVGEPEAPSEYLPWLPGALNELAEFARLPLTSDELARISEILQRSV